MALEFNKTSYLKIYTGEDVLFEDIPLYKAILREARSLGLAGGTVIKGIEGYASKVRGVGRAVKQHRAVPRDEGDAQVFVAQRRQQAV